jgi:hypothetical protein
MLDEDRTSAMVPRSRIDPRGLIGHWFNTERAPRGVASLLIEQRADVLAIRALALAENSHEDWGWTHADYLYASSSSGRDAVAFTASHRVDRSPFVLQANMSKGLLIVSSFEQRADHGITATRMAREFFHRADPSVPRSPNLRPAEPVGIGLSHSSLASSFVGHWRNTNSDGNSIDMVSITSTNGVAKMRVIGRNESGVHDWGVAEVEIYAEAGATLEPGRVKARFDLGSIDVLLHGWVKQGVLVLALFRRFTEDCGKSNYFDREFFYRTEVATESGG